MTTINTLLWATSPSTSGVSFTGGLSGAGGKYFRAKADESGFELADLPLSNVAATTPLSVSGTTTKTISLAGLTTYGSIGDVLVSNGTYWTYVASSGSGSFVRSASPTFTGTVSAVNGDFMGTLEATTIETTFFSAGSNTSSFSDCIQMFTDSGSGYIGFFDKSPVTKPVVNIIESTSVANPVLDTAAFMSQVSQIIGSIRNLTSALGDVSPTGLGLIDTGI